jgi:CMP-N-acetylneuraminic acid synthetase
MDFSIVIPIKENSQRVKNKATRPNFYKNYSLCEWKIYQLTQAFPVEKIFVSTNSVNIKNLVRPFGIGILDRDDYYCDENLSTFPETIKAVAQSVPSEHIVWIPITNPLMKNSSYLDCIEIYEKEVHESGNYDSVISVETLKDFVWDSEKSINYIADGDNHPYSQDLPDWYRLTCGICIRSKEDMVNYRYYVGKRPYMYKVDKIEGWDINNEDEFDLASKLMSYYVDTLC